MDISLTKLPWYAQIGAFVALAVGGCGAFYYYYEMPARVEMKGREQQLAALQLDVKKGLDTARKLPEFRAQVTELEGRLANLRAVLPEEKDAADLLRRLQSVATQSNLEIRSFRPNPTVTKQLHAEWPITLELQGTYHNLAMFFDRVGKFTRIINISNLSIRGRERPEPNLTITATCTATTFVLLDKPNAPAGKGRGAAPAAPAAGSGRSN
jgi:type IV pilus assembly protein PilO